MNCHNSMSALNTYSLPILHEHLEERMMGEPYAEYLLGLAGATLGVDLITDRVVLMWQNSCHNFVFFGGCLRGHWPSNRVVDFPFPQLSKNHQLVLSIISLKSSPGLHAHLGAEMHQVFELLQYLGPLLPLGQ